MAAKKRRKTKLSKKGIQRRRIRRLIILGFVFAGLLVVFGIVSIFMYRYDRQFAKDVICDNVYIGMMDASGMTQEEALAALDEQAVKEGNLFLTMKVGDQSATVTLRQMGYGYENQEEAVAEALDYGKTGNIYKRYFNLKNLEKEPYVVKQDIVLDTDLATDVMKEQAVPLAAHAQDATITKTQAGFRYTKEQEGQTVDLERSLSRLLSHLNGDWGHKDLQMEMSVTEEEPTVFLSDLEEITDQLGYFSTNAGEGARWQNLKSGAQYINGTVVMPGEQVSVHDLTAPYEESRGYVEAGAFEDGQLVQSLGGGICQVSTTLYNALLYAELDIVKRYPHSMLVSYVEPSMDAAIAGDTKDLQFVNNYDTPIYIQGGINEDNQLFFAIYGKETRDPGRSLNFVSETISREEVGTVTNEDGSTSTKTQVKAQLWKIIYQDDEEVSRDTINSSTYMITS